MTRTLVFFVLLSFSGLKAATLPDSIQQKIDAGKFAAAQENLSRLISSAAISRTDALLFSFEIERLERIRKDFPKTEEQVIAALKKYFPQIF